MHRQINLFLSEIQLQLIVPDTIIVLQSNNDGGGAGIVTGCHLSTSSVQISPTRAMFVSNTFDWLIRAGQQSPRGVFVHSGGGIDDVVIHQYVNEIMHYLHST